MTGPTSPVLFAKEIASLMETKYNRLARVWFDDEQILQKWEDKGLTGYDTLILARATKNDLLVSLWVDQGVGGLPVALSSQSDREILLTPIYEKTDFARKLTLPEIRELFEHIFTHPECLAIRGR